MPLTTRDHKAILDIIDIIYSVPDKGSMFSSVCLELQKLIDICSAVLASCDPETGKPSADYAFFNKQEGPLLIYLGHFASLDPFITHGWFEKNGNRVARNTDLVPERRLLNSEFACDFLIPIANVFYGLASTIATQGDKVGAIGLHRQKNQMDFTNHHKEIVNIILPHMARAIRSHQLMHDLDLTKEFRGVIAVDDSGKVFYMNEPAKMALRNKPITAIPDPGLGSQAAFFKGGRETYRIRTVPFGKKSKGKVILLERHPPEHKLSSKLTVFELSRREEEVAMLVVQGLSNLEIAQQLFIAEQTVKDHLHHVFGKMSIRRRSEIAAKVMGLPGKNNL